MSVVLGVMLVAFVVRAVFAYYRMSGLLQSSLVRRRGPGCKKKCPYMAVQVSYFVMLFCEAIVLCLMLFFVTSTFFNARTTAKADADRVPLAERVELQQGLMANQDSAPEYDY